MTELFLKIVNMSISAGWLTFAIVILKLLFKKAPKWLSTVLWCIVGIRLLLPFPIESALSLIPSADTISPEIMYDPNPTIHIGVAALNSTINPIISESFAPAPGDSANPLQIWIPIASVIWMVGAVLMLAYAAFSYVRLKKRLCMAVLLRENIYQSENVISPFVLGLIHPCIYLPFHISDANIAMVVAHEQAHIKRHDHYIKPIGFMLLSIHWFNPILWIAYSLLCGDIELACDEYVVQNLNTEERADYSETLLTYSMPKRMIAACPLAFGAGRIKNRVKNVLNYKKPAFWMIAAAVTACIIAAVCFLTNPKEKASQTGDASQLTDILEIPSTKTLTLDDVLLLSQKPDLTWKDLEVYSYVSVGSGLIRFRYDIDNTFCLVVFPINENAINAAYLCHLLPAEEQAWLDFCDDSIDIRSNDMQDIENFIRKYQQSNTPPE